MIIAATGDYETGARRLPLYIMNSSHYSARCVKITALIGGLAAATAVEVGYLQFFHDHGIRSGN